MRLEGSPNTPATTLLLVDRSCSDIQVFLNSLQSVPAPTVDVWQVSMPDEWNMALTAQAWDLILCDDALLISDPAHMMARIRTAQPQAALIVVSRNGTIRAAVDMMRLGAQGFVEWRDSTRLIELVRQELASTRSSSKSSNAQTPEARYQSIVDEQTELICRYDADFRLTFVNRAYSAWQGQPSEALLGTVFINKIPAAERAQALAKVRA